MRVSDYFNLDLTQPYLDFVDIPLDTDLLVFLDPVAIRSLTSDFGHQCTALIQNYFQAVLEKIKSGKHVEARQLLSSLNERNEFHLGYSEGRSRGHAFGAQSAKSVWDALSKSQASKSGLLQDLEDTCLMIEGIGRDMVSDAVCNIIRGPLIEYTVYACNTYGIPLTPNVDSGPMWNSSLGKWEQKLVTLPVAQNEKIILVPKIMIRHNLSYNYQSYYRHYLLPVMQQAEMSANTGLVQLLRDGSKRVTKKSLLAKYGNSKASVVAQTIRHPVALTQYKQHKEKNVPPPLDHEKLSEIELTIPPDWTNLIEALKNIPSGNSHATTYEKHIEKILSALFYPSLSHPILQSEIHNGRKRIDITYINQAKVGFFSWLAQHYAAPYIFVECKNYGKEDIGNPELDQLSGRFSPSRGTFGVQVCRSLKNKKLFKQRCSDTAKDGRGYIIVLTDDELIELMNVARGGVQSHDFPLLNEKFRNLVS